MKRQAGSHTSGRGQGEMGVLSKVARVFAVVTCITAAGSMVYGRQGLSSSASITPEATSSPAPSASPEPAAPSVVPTEVPVNPSVPTAQAVEPTPGVPHIGIVAGHWGSGDPGAVCPDGLTEAQINLGLAQEAVQILQALGYEADLLEEFDPRLDGYWADALLSIHVDSCDDIPDATPPASGFKVASVVESMVPEAEDRLVNCIAQSYSARTGIYFHENSITDDMTSYHTFFEIDGRTPAAIIEAGFMLKDRQVLTQQPGVLAGGIVDGIVCFIEGERSWSR